MTQAHGHDADRDEDEQKQWAKTCKTDLPDPADVIAGTAPRARRQRRTGTSSAPLGSRLAFWSSLTARPVHPDLSRAGDGATRDGGVASMRILLADAVLSGMWSTLLLGSRRTAKPDARASFATHHQDLQKPLAQIRLQRRSCDARQTYRNYPVNNDKRKAMPCSRKAVKAPGFKLIDDDRKTRRNSASSRGSRSWCISTPRTTPPGVRLRQKTFPVCSDAFAAAGAQVIGISPDSAASHAQVQDQTRPVRHPGADEDNAARPRPTGYGSRNRCTGKSTWVSNVPRF